MSRYKRLRNWPECLEKMSADELRRERAYWEGRMQLTIHRSAHKGMFNRIREIEKELKTRDTL